MKFLIICFLFVSISFGASAQCEKVLFTGKVEDTLRPRNFYNLMVINKTTGRGLFGLPDGHYNVYASAGDTIILSVTGYNRLQTVVKADENCQSKKTWYIEASPQQIEEVIVRPLKSLEQIQNERSELAMRETRTVTGIDMLQSPITALYEAFSKRAKNKRWVAEKKYEDQQKAIVQELLHLYVAFEVIELNEGEFDAFIAFLNVDDYFLKTASEMELITFIQDKFEHFKLLMK
jgi:hypothetical protein